MPDVPTLNLGDAFAAELDKKNQPSTLDLSPELPDEAALRQHVESRFALPLSELAPRYSGALSAGDKREQLVLEQAMQHRVELEADELEKIRDKGAEAMVQHMAQRVSSGELTPDVAKSILRPYFFEASRKGPILPSAETVTETVKALPTMFAEAGLGLADIAQHGKGALRDMLKDVHPRNERIARKLEDLSGKLDKAQSVISIAQQSPVTLLYNTIKGIADANFPTTAASDEKSRTILGAALMQGPTEDARMMWRLARYAFPMLAGYTPADLTDQELEDRMDFDLKTVGLLQSLESGETFPELSKDQLAQISRAGEWLQPTDWLSARLGGKAAKTLTKIQSNAAKALKTVAAEEAEMAAKTAGRVTRAQKILGGALDKTATTAEAALEDPLKRGVILGGGMLLAGGEPTTALLTSVMGTTSAGSSAARALKAAPNLLRRGAEAVRTPVSLPSLEMSRKIGEIVKGAGHGMAPNALLSLASENPEEQGTLLAGGAAFGTFGYAGQKIGSSVVNFGNSYWNPVDDRVPGVPPVLRAPTTETGNAADDAGHLRAVNQLSNAQHNRVEAFRLFVKKLNPKNNVVVLTDEDMKTRTGGESVSGFEAENEAGGRTSYVTLGSESLAHEVGHTVLDSLPADSRASLVKITKSLLGEDSLETSRQEYNRMLGRERYRTVDDFAEEYLADTFQTVLNGAPAGQLGTPRALAHQIYASLGHVLEDLGLRPMQPGGPVQTSSTLGYTPSFILNDLLKNYATARGLDMVAAADEVAQSAKEWVGKPPVNGARPAIADPKHKKGLFDGTIQDGNGNVVGENPVILSVLPDTLGGLHMYNVKFSTPGAGTWEAMLPESSLVPTPEKTEGKPAPKPAPTPTTAVPTAPKAAEPEQPAPVAPPTATPSAETPPAATPVQPKPVEGIYTDEAGRQRLAGGVATPEVQAQTVKVIEDELSKAQSQRIPLQTSYDSAKTDEVAGRKDLTEQQREQQRLLADEGEKQGHASGLRQLYDKVFVPLTSFKTKAGKANIFAFSLDKVIRNVDMLGAWLNESGRAAEFFGPTGWTSFNDPAFVSDFQTYLENQSNGYRGDGKPIVRPPGTDPKRYPAQNPDYTPKPLNTDKARAVNVLMGLKPVEHKQVLSVAAQFVNDLAAANGIDLVEVTEPGEMGPTAKREYNPTSTKLREMGFDTNLLHQSVEQLRTERMATPPKPRPDLAAVKSPVQGSVQAGFMPAQRTYVPAPSVESEAFKKWFKNSVVVDKSGRPLPMYHGSVSDFTTFDKSKIRANDLDAPFNGFWFSSEPSTGPAMRSADFVKEYYLSLQNPAPESVYRRVAAEVARSELPEGVRSDGDAVRMQLEAMGYDGVVWADDPKLIPTDDPNVLKVERPRFHNYTLRKAGDGGWDLYRGNELITGYYSPEDFQHTAREKTVVVFNPSQIKSTDNRGTWDPNDPDTRYMPAEKTEQVQEPVGGTMHTLNIGRAIGDTGKLLDESRVRQELESKGLRVRTFEEQVSNTEPTFVVRVEGSLSAAAWDDLSNKLEQQAIAVWHEQENRGELFGDGAPQWRPFNPEFFLEPKLPDPGQVPSPELMDKFADLHEAQRYGGPEGMFDPRNNPDIDFNTGTFSYHLEHLGDLIHRLSYSGGPRDFGGGGPQWSVPESVNKLNRFLRQARRDGGNEIANTVEQELRSNYDYARRNNKVPKSLTFGEYRRRWEAAADRYAQSYRGLVPVTQFQKSARDIAVSFSERRFAQAWLEAEQLKTALESPDWEKKYFEPLPKSEQIPAGPKFMPGVQFEGEQLPHSVGGTLDLVHYAVFGLKQGKTATLSPEFFGQGPTPKSERAGMDRVYFYVSGAENTADIPIISRGPESRVIATVSGNKIYDAHNDVLGYKKMINRWAADEMLVDKGYVGLLRKAMIGGDINGKPYTQVEIFVPVKVAPEPGGGPSAPSVESEAFKKWFGDWEDPKAFTSRAKGAVSQVVDLEGRPKRVYHGTGADFSSFRSSGKGTVGLGVLGEYQTDRTGIFFSESPETASSFANKESGKVIPAYLDIKSPANLSTTDSTFDVLEEVGMSGRRALRGGFQTWELFDGENGKEFVERLKKAGYTGAWMVEYIPELERSDKVWVAFDPEQIKSAYNRGTFDPNDPDIRHMPAASPAQEKAFGNSKIRDENGKLTPMFHFTKRDFKKFGWMWGQRDLGWHFGTAEAALDRFAAKGGAQAKLAWGDTRALAGGRTIPVFLNVEKPLVMRDVGTWDDPGEIAYALDEFPEGKKVVSGIRKVIGDYERAIENFNRPISEWDEFKQPRDTIAFNALRSALKEHGYDGIAYQNLFESPGSWSVIALENNQIMPAFDPEGTKRWMPAKPNKNAKVWVDTAAVRDVSTGKIWKASYGGGHYSAYSQIAKERGIDNPWQLDLDGLEDGFVLSNGNFVDRDLAMEVAKTAGQISDEAVKEIEDNSSPGGLEATTFDENRRWMPAKPKKGAKRWIESAALRDGKKVFTAPTHAEATMKMPDDTDWSNVEDGFVTNDGEFLDRESAMILAEKAGQIDPDEYAGNLMGRTLRREPGGEAPPWQLESLTFEQTRKYMPAPPVESEAFKKWFGDSKVVDEEGKPLVVSHGTAKDFTAFSDEKAAGGGLFLSGLGHWFGRTDGGTSNAFAGKVEGSKNVPAYLSLQNPIVFRSAAAEQLKSLDRAIAGFKSLSEIKEHVTGLSIKNYLRTELGISRLPGYPAFKDNELYRVGSVVGKLNEMFRKEFEAADPIRQLLDHTNDAILDKIPEGERGAALREELIRQGFDGVMLLGTYADSGLRKGGADDWFIAFHPEQIKSAIGNRGTFDPNDPDIRHMPADPMQSRTWKQIAKHLRPEELGKVRKDTVAEIVRIFELLPPDRQFEAAALAGLQKIGWYKRASEAISFLFGNDAERFTLLLAAMSPQQSVQENMVMSLQIWNDWLAAGRPTDPEAVRPIVDKFAQLDARSQNGVSALSGTARDGTKMLDEFAKLSGFKVESFYRNLMGRVTAVTNDTWMSQFGEIAAALFGTKAGYQAYSAKVRRVADRLGLDPREVQETVWSFFKTLTEATTVDRTARKALSELTDEDILKTPEFYDDLISNPKIQAELVRLGFDQAKLAELGARKDARRPAPRKGSLADVALEEGGRGRLRDLERIADRAQRVADKAREEARKKAEARAAGQGTVVPDDEGENPF